MKDISERLRELRIRNGLKQRELADRLGVPTSCVGGWECGSAAVPRLRIYQICKEFGVRREWLVDGTGAMFETPTRLDGEQVPNASEALKDAAVALFVELSPKGQDAVLQALREYLRERGIDTGGGSWPFK